MMARMLVVLLLSAAPLASAADWVTVAQAKDGSEYAVDRDSVTVVSREDELIEAWHRMTHPRMKTSLSYNNIRRRMLHNCVTHKTELIEVWSYFNDQQLRERNLPDWLTLPMDLRPGSVGYGVHRAVCSLGAEGNR